MSEEDLIDLQLAISFNENGFMDTKSFFWYIDHFMKFKPPSVPFMVLFYDQHSTHMAYEVLQKWNTNKIYVIATKENLTQLMSGLDDLIFRKSKSSKFSIKATDIKII